MLVDPTLLVGFLLFSAVLSAVPGPSVVLSTGRAVTQGRGPALRIVAGSFLGGLLLVTCAISGLGAALAASASLLTVVKWLGAAYLLFLGVRALLAARRTTGDAMAGAPQVAAEARSRPLREGLLVGVSNPKSLVTLTAILPQFVDPELGSVPLQLAIIGLAGAVAQLLIEATWVWAAARLRSWFLRRPRRLAALEAGGGLAMIGLAGRVALQRPAT